MDNLPTVFNYQEQEVRTIINNDEVWFVVADVCKVLDIKDVKQAADRLDEDERGWYSIPTPRGNQSMTCANESGLYEFMFTSRKPEAKAFKRWIKQEVLPAIRKTGKYDPMGQQLSMIEEVARLDERLHELSRKQQRFLHDEGDLETTAVAIHRLTQSIGEMKAVIVKFQKTLSRTEYAQREDVAEMERTLKDAIFYVQKLQKTNELHMELQERSLDIYGFAESALEALGQLPPGETQKQLKHAKDEDGW